MGDLERYRPHHWKIDPPVGDNRVIWELWWLIVRSALYMAIMWVLLKVNPIDWINVVIAPPALVAMIVLGGPVAARRRYFTKVVEKNGGDLINLAATVGVGALIGVAVVAAIADPQSWVTEPTFRFVNVALPLGVMWLTVSNAGWTILTVLGFAVVPETWTWAKEWLARLATGTALLTPALLLAFVYLFTELAGLRMGG